MSGLFRPSRRAMLKVGLAGAATVASPAILRLTAAGPERADQDRHAAGADRRAGLGRPAAEARRRALRQAAERQGRHPRPADRAVDRGHRRQPRQLRAQGAGNGGAPRLPPADRHHAVVGGAGGGAQARRMGLDLHLVRQWRRPADRRELRAELLPRQHLGPDGHARGFALPARQAKMQKFYALGHGLRLGPQQRAGVRGRGEAGQEGVHRQGLRADRHQGLLDLHHQDPPVRRRRRLPGAAGRRQQRVPVPGAAVPPAREGASC